MGKIGECVAAILFASFIIFIVGIWAGYILPPPYSPHVSVAPAATAPAAVAAPSRDVAKEPPAPIATSPQIVALQKQVDDLTARIASADKASIISKEAAEISAKKIADLTARIARAEAAVAASKDEAIVAAKKIADLQEAQLAAEVRLIAAIAEMDARETALHARMDELAEGAKVSAESEEGEVEDCSYGLVYSIQLAACLAPLNR